jgi:hypothetical protein
MRSVLTFISKCTGVSEPDFEALINQAGLCVVVYNTTVPPSHLPALSPGATSAADTAGSITNRKGPRGRAPAAISANGGGQASNRNSQTRGSRQSALPSPAAPPADSQRPGGAAVNGQELAGPSGSAAESHHDRSGSTIIEESSAPTAPDGGS